jgi:hypothetical protein
MIDDKIYAQMVQLLRGPALNAFAAKMPLLARVMRRPVETEEDKVIRAAVSYIITELHVTRITYEDGSAGMAGDADSSGSGA